MHQEWQPIMLKASNPLHNITQSHGEVLFRSSRAQFGVISDIDDTIPVTDILYRLRVLRITFLKILLNGNPCGVCQASYKSSTSGTTMKWKIFIQGINQTSYRNILAKSKQVEF